MMFVRSSKNKSFNIFKLSSTDSKWKQIISLKTNHKEILCFYSASGVGWLNISEPRILSSIFEMISINNLHNCHMIGNTNIFKQVSFSLSPSLCFAFFPLSVSFSSLTSCCSTIYLFLFSFLSPFHSFFSYFLLSLPLFSSLFLFSSPRPRSLSLFHFLLFLFTILLFLFTYLSLF